MWFTLIRDEDYIKPDEDILLYRASRMLTGTDGETGFGIFDSNLAKASITFYYRHDEKTWTIGAPEFPYISTDGSVKELQHNLQIRVDTVRSWVKNIKNPRFELI